MIKLKASFGKVFLILFLFVLYTNSGFTKSCDHIISQILTKEKIKFPVLKIQSESLAKLVPEYTTRMLEIEKLVPDPLKYVKYYVGEYDRVPTNQEVIDYLLTANRMAIDRLKSFKGINRNIDHYVDIAIDFSVFSQRQIDRMVDYAENHEALMHQRFRINHRKNKKIADSSFIISFQTRMQGAVGEFDVVMRLNGVRGQGIHFKFVPNETHKSSRILSKLLEKRVKKVFTELETLDDKELSKVFDNFPHIFRVSEGQSTSEIITRGREWIESKEIDVITKKDERYVVWEVKNYNDLVTMGTLEKGSNSRKSILDQQLELREILEFLGMNELFSQGIIFRRGVDLKAAKLLTDLGINVVGKKRD